MVICHIVRPFSEPTDISCKIRGSPSTFSRSMYSSQICDEENVTDDGKYEGKPTLVSEIPSPSTRSKDMVSKLDLYMRSGIREYWIADPNNGQFWQYLFNSERELENTNVFNGVGTVEQPVSQDSI